MPTSRTDHEDDPRKTQPSSIPRSKKNNHSCSEDEEVKGGSPPVHAVKDLVDIEEEDHECENSEEDEDHDPLDRDSFSDDAEEELKLE